MEGPAGVSTVTSGVTRAFGGVTIGAEEVTRSDEGPQISSGSGKRSPFLQIGVVLIGLAGTIANGLMLFVLAYFKSNRQHTTSVLILNQTAIDLYSCLVLVVTYMLKIVNYQGHLFTDNSSGYVVCLLFESSMLLGAGLVASIASLVIIAVERYIKIVHSVTHKRLYRPWMLSWAVALAWIYGAVTIVPVFAVTTALVDGQCQPLSVWLSPSSIHQLAYGIFAFTTNFCFPVLTFIYCYGRIVKIMRGREYAKLKRKGIGQAGENGRRPTIMKAKNSYCMERLKEGEAGRTGTGGGGRGGRKRQGAGGKYARKGDPRGGDDGSGPGGEKEGKGEIDLVAKLSFSTASERDCKELELEVEAREEIGRGGGRGEEGGERKGDRGGICERRTIAEREQKEVLLKLEADFYAEGNSSVEGSLVTAAAGGSGVRRGFSRRRWSVVKTLVLVSAVFVVCYLPIDTIYAMMNAGYHPVDMESDVWYVVMFLSFINLLLNPILYAWQYDTVRTSFRLLFLKSKTDGVSGNVAGQSTSRVPVGTSSTQPMAARTVSAFDVSTGSSGVIRDQKGSSYSLRRMTGPSSVRNVTGSSMTLSALPGSQGSPLT